MTSRKNNIYRMTASIDISQWAWKKCPKDLAEIPLLFSDGRRVWHILQEIIFYIQETIIEDYLQDWKIKTLVIQIHQLNMELKTTLSTANLFRCWKFLDRVMDKMSDEALKVECYEGIINLQKLRELL